MSAVRLFHEYHAPTGWHSYCTEAQAVFEWQRKEPYIALPAAEHAALVALLGEARAALAEALMVVGTLDADRPAYCASLLKQVDLARNLGLPTMDVIDAALAGLGCKPA